MQDSGCHLFSRECSCAKGLDGSKEFSVLAGVVMRLGTIANAGETETFDQVMEMAFPKARDMRRMVTGISPGAIMDMETKVEEILQLNHATGKERVSITMGSDVPGDVPLRLLELVPPMVGVSQALLNGEQRLIALAGAESDLPSIVQEAESLMAGFRNSMGPTMSKLRVVSAEGSVSKSMEERLVALSAWPDRVREVVRVQGAARLERNIREVKSCMQQFSVVAGGSSSEWKLGLIQQLNEPGFVVDNAMFLVIPALVFQCDWRAVRYCVSELQSGGARVGSAHVGMTCTPIAVIKATLEAFKAMRKAKVMRRFVADFAEVEQTLKLLDLGELRLGAAPLLANVDPSGVFTHAAVFMGVCSATQATLLLARLISIPLPLPLPVPQRLPLPHSSKLAHGKGFTPFAWSCPCPGRWFGGAGEGPGSAEVVDGPLAGDAGGAPLVDPELGLAVRMRGGAVKLRSSVGGLSLDSPGDPLPKCEQCSLASPVVPPVKVG